MNEQQSTQTQADPGFRLLRAIILFFAGILLLVLLLLGALTALLSTERGSHWLLGTATGFIPEQTLQLQFAQSQGTFLHGLSLYDLHITLGENRITIEELRSRWNPFSLLSGEFILDSLTVQGLAVDWQGGDADETAAPATDLSRALDGIFPLPVAIRLTEFVVTGVDIRFNDTEVELDSLRFSATLREYTLRLDALHFDGLDTVVDASLSMVLAGDYAVDVTATWRYSDQANGTASISGDLNQLLIQHQLQEPLLLDSEGTFTLGLADRLNARSDGGLPLSIDLAHSLPEPQLPFEAINDIVFTDTLVNTRGWLDELRIDGATGIETDRLPGPPLVAELQWQARYSNTTVTIDELVATTASGRLLTSGSVTLQDVTCIALRLELDEDNPANYLDAIPDMLSISGIQVLADLELALAEPGPSGTVTIHQMAALLDGYPLAGDGTLRFDSNTLEIENLNLQSDDSAVHISGRYSDTLSARLSVTAPALDSFYPPLSGSLMADVDIAGTLDALQIDIDARARDLQYENIHIDEIDIQGETRSNNQQIVNARVRGARVNDQIIDSATLRFEGQPTNHNLTLDVNSAVADLSLVATGGYVEDAWSGQLQSSELQSEYGRWQQIRSSDLQISASQVTLEESCWLQGDASFCLGANLDNGDELLAALALQGYPLALLNDSLAESIISAFDGETGDYPQLPADVRLPFTLHPDVAVLGTANIQADVSGNLSDLPSLSLQFSAWLQDLEAYLRADPLPPDLTGNGNNNNNDINGWLIEQFLWEEASFSGTLDSGHWDISGRMAFFQRDVSGSGMAMRGTTTASVLLDPEYTINGRLELDFDDLAWIEDLVPQIHNASGRLDGVVNFSGSLEAPGIGADINLRDGALDLPALGLELHAVELALTSSDTETFRLLARATSGNGQLELDADILQPLTDDRRLDLSLRGENFNVANTSEVTVDISPDLRLEASGSGINMTGNLTIPLLDARITQLPEAAIDVSSDAVLVSQLDDAAPVRNAALGDRGPLSDIPITGNVRVILGDDVRFSGFGLSARLAGMLDINQRAGSAPLAYGELEVLDGSFQTYGRTLTIEQGKLLFFGPFDNPAIDIRAVRQVEHMRVGVQMNGTIRNIRSQLFSTPALPDGDIIAVMITGRPLAEIGQSPQDNSALVGAITTLGITQSAGLTDAVRGQLGLDTLAIDSTGDVHDSSLTLGKYITPRIFVRYAVGLFETANSLAIDYSITDNIKLEAKSGQAQSLDITYTLER